MTEILIKLIPLVILVLAWKTPRIALIVFALFLKLWWLAAGLTIVALIPSVRIRVRKMSPEQYQEFKEQEQNDT